MAYPAYVDNGGIAVDTDGQSCAPSYPTTVNVNNILIAALMDADNDTFDVPNGWMKIYEDGVNTGCSTAFYWRRADGTETGTVTFTSVLASGQLTAGIIYRYSGCTTYGFPFERELGVAVSAGATQTPDWSGDTLGTQRLAVAFNVVEDDTIDGITLNGFTEDSRLSDATGSDCHFATASLEMTATTKPTACIWSSSASELHGLLGLYLLPAPDAPVTLNSPSEAVDIGNDLTPTLEFTADAISDLDVEYQVRIGLTAGLEEKNIYYFDGSDVAAAGVGWTDVTNADDGDTGTFAFVATTGEPPLTVFGTDAPASGGTISSIRGRFYGNATGTFGGSVNVTFYKSDGTTFVGYVTKSNGQFASAAWSQWAEFVIPIGVTYAELQSMSIAVGGSAGTGSVVFYKAEIEATSYEGDLYDSEVPDATFTNTTDGGDTHPFTDNEKVDYTVQGGSPLTYDTYYWTARAKNPTGENLWDDWVAETLSTGTTYYVDGSIGGATDADGAWTGATNLDDGDVNTWASGTTEGNTSSNYIGISGTSCPSDGILPIDYVEARHSWGHGPDYSTYVELNEPTSGWTWDLLSKLESKSYYSIGQSTCYSAIYEQGGGILGTANEILTFSGIISIIELRVTTKDSYRAFTISSGSTTSSSFFSFF